MQLAHVQRQREGQQPCGGQVSSHGGGAAAVGAKMFGIGLAGGSAAAATVGAGAAAAARLLEAASYAPFEDLVRG